MEIASLPALVGATVTALLSLPVMAAEQPASADFTLGEVVVTARTRDNQLIGGAQIEPGSMRTLDRGSVDEAIELISGTSMGNTGGSRNERLIFIRGFDRFQTTLSIDGVRVFLPADNRIDFARFLTADLSAIQVSKGYVSVLDGPGALGGAVNLVTRKPTAPLDADAVAQISLDGDGSHAAHQVSGRIGTLKDRWYLQASGTSTRADHWSLSKDFKPTTLEDGGARTNSNSHDYRVNLKAGFTPNDSDEYALNHTKQAGQKNAPYHVTDTASTRYWSWPYWDLDSLYFLSHTTLPGGGWLNSRVYVNSFSNALYSYDNAAQTVQSLPRAFRSYYDDTAQGARIEYGRPLGAGNTLRAAAHYRRDEHVEWQEGFIRVPATGNPFSNVPYPEARQTTLEDTWSLALEDTRQLGPRIDLVTGVSYDWTNLKRAEDVNVTVSGSSVNQLPVPYPLRNANAWNGQAALSYALSDATRLHLSASSRARFPTLFERFSSRMGTAVPNPDIDAERAVNYELGASARHASGAEVEAALFYSDIRDALLSVPVVFGAPINATLNQTRNVGEGRYTGIELQGSAPLGATLKLAGNYTWLNRELTDPTNAAFRPTGVPTHRALAYLEWSAMPALSVSPSIEWASDRWTVTSSSSITPPRYYRTGSYTLVNLALDWRLNPQIDVLLGGRNLLDRSYELVDGFPEAGRSLYVNLRAQLR